MPGNREAVSVKGTLVLLLVASNAIVLREAAVNKPEWYSLLFLTIPLLITSLIAFRR